MAYSSFKETFEALFGRDVDLVLRDAAEAGRNNIRRRRILTAAEAING